MQNNLNLIKLELVETKAALTKENKKNEELKAQLEHRKYEKIIDDLKTEIKNLRSTQKQKLSEINRDYIKQTESLQVKLKTNCDIIKSLEKTIEKNKVREISINHKSGIFKLTDNKDGSF